MSFASNYNPLVIDWIYSPHEDVVVRQTKRNDQIISANVIRYFLNDARQFISDQTAIDQSWNVPQPCIDHDVKLLADRTLSVRVPTVNNSSTLALAKGFVEQQQLRSSAAAFDNYDTSQIITPNKVKNIPITCQLIASANDCCIATISISDILLDQVGNVSSRAVKPVKQHGDAICDTGDVVIRKK